MNYFEMVKINVSINICLFELALPFVLCESISDNEEGINEVLKSREISDEAHVEKNETQQ